MRSLLREHGDNRAAHGSATASSPGSLRRSSRPALAASLVLGLGFLISTLFRVSGSYTHYDLRIVARLIPERDHTHILALVHPLVHLGDAAFVGAVSAGAILILWSLGYRRTWAVLAGLLSWPVELICKAALPQPAGLGSQQASVTLSSLVHGAGTRTVGGWLQHAAPESLLALAGQAGGLSVNLVSSYPSGTTARAAFAVGLLVWLCLRADVPLFSGILALALLVPLTVVGLAMVLYDWHWPSDVLGGYILGFALLALSLAILRRPAPATLPSVQIHATPGVPSIPPRAHSSRSPLPWIPN